jgi:hypothetical protein
MVKTDLSIAVPEGTYGRVAPRSGLGPSRLLPCSLRGDNLTISCPQPRNIRLTRGRALSTPTIGDLSTSSYSI